MNLLPSPIYAALERGQTVVTSNQRAARVLHRVFDSQMRASGLKRWQPAAILTLDAWASSLWHRMLMEGTANRMLLNRSQEHAIWRALIAADRELSALGSSDALAEMAAEAWSLLWQYNGEGRLRELGMSADTAAFQRWAMAFDRRCRRDGYLSGAQLWATLEAAATRGELPVFEAGISLVGFDRMAPAVERLFETLRRAGFAVDEVQPGALSERRMLFEAIDERDELGVAARWARRRLEENPAARLAIIVPELEAHRAELDRTLREVLAPDLQEIAAEAEEDTPYEFSLGRPLSSTALANTALQLIRWTMEPLEVAHASDLLLSPFFAGAGWDIAEFDAFKLRRASLLRAEITLQGMIRAVAEERESKASEELAQLLIRLRSMRKAASEAGIGANGNAERPYADWSDAFHKILQAAGWPGLGALDSTSFQARQRWESALDELCTLDFDSSRLSAAQALSALERIVRQTIFAPESHDAPVQVMGPLEAAGQEFDGVWFMGASDLGWPRQKATSPLLPWNLQKELHMPGADDAIDRDIARAITRRIAGAAKEVVFSYAAEGSEAAQQASPLLDELNLTVGEAGDLCSPEQVNEIGSLETVADDLDLPALPDQVHRGGAAVLQAQAACGFKAFAEHRLWSSELKSQEPGLDATERGSLVHKAMERFWSEVGNQAALKAMTVQERNQLLDESIEAALGKAIVRHQASTAWELAYVETQRQRLQALLRPWLEIELTRPKFVVRETELELEDVAIGPLRLKVRVDRVDESAGGSLIIDYKTGPASPRDWLSERPDAPQLPLYAVVAAERPVGVAFALLRAGEDLDLQGFAADAATLGKSAKFDEGVESFAEQVAEWRRVLTNLAEDFCNGDARVAPKSYPKTCQYCVQRLLCRLDPASLIEAEEQEGEVQELG